MYGTLHCHVAIFSRAITLTGQVSEDPLLWAQQPARTGGDGIAADRVSRTHFFCCLNHLCCQMWGFPEGVWRGSLYDMWHAGSGHE